VSDALKAAQVFVAEFPNGYASRHEHQRQTVLAQLEASPNKFAYYSRRVADLLRARGDYVRAYFVLRKTDGIAAQRISRSALFDTMRQGDFASQLLVLEDILESARRPGADADDLMLLLLSKAQALQYTGQGSQIDDVLSEADRQAARSEDPELKLRAREARSAYAAATSLTGESLESLQQLELEYLAVGDRWSAGRLASELSALFIRAKRFSEALEPSERALKIFEELGDDYGISVALRNRASAFGGIPGRESEATGLMERLRDRQEQAGTRRERAWLCNYMVRTLRRKKQFEEALRYGQEAVAIGEKLGDLHVVGTNRVCVGNVYREMEKLSAALAEYSAAGHVAQRLCDKSLESSACRLAAGVYRRQGNNRVALQHAQLAVSLIEGTFASELADALEEVGNCQHESRNWTEAAESYAKAAAASTDIEEKSRLTVEALSTCLDEGLNSVQYLNCLEQAYARGAQGDGPVTEQLFQWMGDLLKSVHVDYAIRLFGLHLRLMFKGLDNQFHGSCSKKS